MSLDGIFLHCIKAELENQIIGAKVDRVYEPTREDIILSLRTRDRGNKKLLLCARANSPRVSLTEAAYENPQNPPMLCMLLRKRLGGATVTAVRQESCDRILYIDFLATNEMGEKENLTLAIEIMAQYSNVILMDDSLTIIDALKRVDYSKSSYRLVLPSVAYQLPPRQDKLNVFCTDKKDILSRVQNGDAKAYMSAIEGVSPLVSRELEMQSPNAGVELLRSYENGSEAFYLIKDENGKPFEFSYMPITQYGTSMTVEKYDSASELLDDYYARRDSIERMVHRTYDVRRVLINAKERIARKLDIQRAELEACKDRETLRIYAELINANLYKLEKGHEFFELENYYDNNNLIKIPVDPAISPAQNSQKYFKEYKKTYTAEKKLTEQIEQGLLDLEYIDSVLDALSRVENEKDILAIKGELIAEGYIKNKYQANGKLSKKDFKNGKPVSSLPPIEYMTTDGYRVLVGRNNLQNDKLSMKTANKLDMWMHTKDFPGSHVIIENQNGQVSDQAIEEAAIIAAFHSTAGDSGAKKIPVDYTLVKNLKKPTGARPGKVIFHENWTIYADINPDFVESLRKDNK